MPRKKEDFEAMRETTRQKIDAVALSLFARKGLSITMDEIAKTARLSKGLLYNHYSSKEEMILEFIKRATTTSAQATKDIAVQNSSALKKIKAITEFMCFMLSKQPAGIEYFMFMVQVDLSGFQSNKKLKYSVNLPDPIDSLADIIKQGQQEGSIVSGEPKQLSTAYWAMVQGCCCYLITGKSIAVKPIYLLRLLVKEECL